MKKPSKSPTKTTRKKPLVVHLGNRGVTTTSFFLKEKLYEKTIAFAKRFKSLNFIGIDPHGFPRTRKNWKQLRTDALKGLNKLEDNSVNMISSDMMIGYYGKRASFPLVLEYPNIARTYATNVFKIARKKLKSKGIIYATVDADRVELIIKSATAAGFSKEKISITKIAKENEAKNSFWTKEFAENHLTEMFKIRIEK